MKKKPKAKSQKPKAMAQDVRNILRHLILERQMGLTIPVGIHRHTSDRR